MRSLGESLGASDTPTAPPESKSRVKSRRKTRPGPTEQGQPAKPPVGALIPQPHGGALRNGGPGGGGSGRPPSILRERLRGSFAQRVRVLEEIADGQVVHRVRLAGGKETETVTSASPTDRIRAIDVMGKYGIGTIREVSADEVRERLRATVGILRRELPEVQSAAIIQQLREVWST